MWSWKIYEIRRIYRFFQDFFHYSYVFDHRYMLGTFKIYSGKITLWFFSVNVIFSYYITNFKHSWKKHSCRPLFIGHYSTVSLSGHIQKKVVSHYPASLIIQAALLSRHYWSIHKNIESVRITRYLIIWTLCLDNKAVWITRLCFIILTPIVYNTYLEEKMH